MIMLISNVPNVKLGIPEKSFRFLRVVAVLMIAVLPVPLAVAERPGFEAGCLKRVLMEARE